jgi:Mce-associated membrane protein
VATVAVIGALLTAVVATVTFAVLLTGRVARDRAGTEALATARSFAVTVTSYGYQHLDADTAAVLDGATGDFHDTYASASAALCQVILSEHRTARGTVVAAGVESTEPDRVVVVLAVNQNVSGAAGTASSPIRMLMTLVPRGGRWLVSELEFQ